jgi:adenylylsulfate kinase
VRDALLITGSMGSGKTSMLGEASDILQQRHVVHGCLDLDWLAHVSGLPAADLLERNLSAVAANFAAVGIDRVVIAGAVETRAELERIKRAVDVQRIVTCRLRAPLEVMEARVSARERGIFATRYIDRVRVLEKLLDDAGLEDFEIATGSRSITRAATEMLQHAGWIDK